MGELININFLSPSALGLRSTMLKKHEMENDPSLRKQAITFGYSLRRHRAFDDFTIANRAHRRRHRKEKPGARQGGTSPGRLSRDGARAGAGCEAQAAVLILIYLPCRVVGFLMVILSTPSAISAVTASDLTPSSNWNDRVNKLQLASCFPEDRRNGAIDQDQSTGNGQSLST